MKKPFTGFRICLVASVLSALLLFPFSTQSQSFQIIWAMDGNLGGSSSSPNFNPSDAGLTGAHPHSLPSVLYYSLGGSDYAYGTTYWHATGVEKYLSFSFSVSTYEYALTSVSYRIRRSASGPTGARLRSSLDGFSADLSSSSLGSDGTFYDVNVPMGVTGLSNGIEFRLYSDNAVSYQGTFYFDQIVINGTVSSIVLPVDLTYFRLKRSEMAVLLEWETASEHNSKEFVIERSQDLNTFEAIGTLPATGFSSEQIAYTFLDKNPLPGINYYRIRMVDQDGQFNFSKTLDIIIDPGYVNFTVSPNPSLPTQIRIKTDMQNPAELSLINISGQNIPIGTVISQGNFMDLFPNQTLSSGLYVLSLKLNGKWQHRKVLVP